MKLFGRMKICSWAAIVLLLLCSVGLGLKTNRPRRSRCQRPPAPRQCPHRPWTCLWMLRQPIRPRPMIWPKAIPSGTKTGTVNDVVASDTKKGLTLADVVNQVGQNRIAINFTWTLVAGFLVMFMQAGFAIVETGLCRAKNANHTMMMNFMVYGFGLFAFWVCGFAIQMGEAQPYATLGGAIR